ncbi:MAG: O-antigen ligase family protein [Gemmatimonadaceae bacterium]|nr:O-antigen ligase family protein [Gemmatimonadaceae bacterium]
MQALSLTPAYSAAPTSSVRHLATLIVVATLPLTYAMTLRIVFPFKIYELVLCTCAGLMFWEGRVLVAPGLARYAKPIAAFLAWAAIVLSIRIAVPLESFTTEGFEARIGPVGDGVIKIAYWLLAFFAFALVATAAYEDARRVGRWWCIGAIGAAIYGWLLLLSSVFSLPAPLLPGMLSPQIINIAGRELFRGGTFEEGNYFAMYLLTSLAVALWMRWRWTAVFMATTVFITFSTANVVALMLFGCIYALGIGAQDRDPRGKVYAFAIFTAITAAVLTILVATGYVSEFFIAKLSTEEFGSKLDRVDLAVAGLRMSAEHPLMGVGLSHYGYNYRPYQLTDFFDRFRPVKPIANNPWVELVAETGLIGAAFVLTFARRVWQKASGADGLAFRAGLAGVALGLFTFPSITVLFIWAFCGLTVGVRLREEHEARVAHGDAVLPIT